jgi:hypothetical protein
MPSHQWLEEVMQHLFPEKASLKFSGTKSGFIALTE